MFEKFGEFDSADEINEAAAAQLAEGDTGAVMEIALENGLDEEDVNEYLDGDVGQLVTVTTAALGKIEVECRELKPKEIMEDWVVYIRYECMASKEMAAAVRRKGKSLKGCIAALLKWSFANQMQIDQEIVKAAGVTSGRVTLGIPGMGRAKKIIRAYYTEGEV